MGHVVYDTLSLKRFLRLPEAKPALEYLQGKVVQKVSPKALHSRIQYKFLMRLSAFAEPLKLGEPYPELRCTFAGESFVPDIAFFAPGRMPRDAKGRLVDDVVVPPDLMIEVLSPGQTEQELAEKLTRCVANGVRLGWLVHPRPERVLVVRPDRPIEVLRRGDVLGGDDVLPGFLLPIDELFDWLVVG